MMHAYFRHAPEFSTRGQKTSVSHRYAEGASPRIPLGLGSQISSGSGGSRSHSLADKWKRRRASTMTHSPDGRGRSLLSASRAAASSAGVSPDASTSARPSLSVPSPPKRRSSGVYDDIAWFLEAVRIFGRDGVVAGVIREDPHSAPLPGSVESHSAGLFPAALPAVGTPVSYAESDTAADENSGDEDENKTGFVVAR